MKVQSIPIASIIVKDRARESDALGDIEALAFSIEKVGLIQPITITDKMVLLAGQRRLEAHKFLKRTHIDAIIRPSTEKFDAFLIELLENTQRKDFRYPEKAKLTKKIFDCKRFTVHTLTHQAGRLG